MQTNTTGLLNGILANCGSNFSIDDQIFMLSKAIINLTLINLKDGFAGSKDMVCYRTYGDDLSSSYDCFNISIESAHTDILYYETHTPSINQKVLWTLQYIVMYVLFYGMPFVIAALFKIFQGRPHPVNIANESSEVSDEYELSSTHVSMVDLLCVGQGSNCSKCQGSNCLKFCSCSCFLNACYCIIAYVSFNGLRYTVIITNTFYFKDVLMKEQIAINPLSVHSWFTYLFSDVVASLAVVGILELIILICFIVITLIISRNESVISFWRKNIYLTTLLGSCLAKRFESYNCSLCDKSLDKDCKCNHSIFELNMENILSSLPRWEAFSDGLPTYLRFILYCMFAFGLSSRSIIPILFTCFNFSCSQSLFDVLHGKFFFEICNTISAPVHFTIVFI